MTFVREPGRMARIIAALDWWYSSKPQHWFGARRAPGIFSDFETLPMWPRLWCWMFTRHKVELKWADYMNDVSGIRCRCDKIDKENTWDRSKHS